VDYGDFFVTGDEWGLVEVVPAENREYYAEIARQFAEHHKDTEFGPTGWTTSPFILRGPAVSLSVRGIRPQVFTEAVANVLVPAQRVTTCEDFTGPPFPCTGCMAWKVPSNKAFAAGFYGRIPDGILASLWWAPHSLEEPTADAIAQAIGRFGSIHRLLLAVGAEGVIDFEDREAIAKYLGNSHDE
jgi:hypothetical protein